MQKADDLAEKLHHDDFKATEGWVRRWIARENINFSKPAGEQREADFPAASEWLRTEWPAIIANYSR